MPVEDTHHKILLHVSCYKNNRKILDRNIFCFLLKTDIFGPKHILRNLKHWVYQKMLT